MFSFFNTKSMLDLKTAKVDSYFSFILKKVRLPLSCNFGYLIISVHQSTRFLNDINTNFDIAHALTAIIIKVRRYEHHNQLT